MRGTTNLKYIITESHASNLKQLQNKIKGICHTKILWENYITKGMLMQCHRSQEWGWSASTAMLTQENYLENATICTKYRSKLEQVEKRKIMNQQNRTLTRTKTFNLDTRSEQQFPQLRAPRTFETSIQSYVENVWTQRESTAQLPTTVRKIQQEK
ncbi:hypothetical protein ANTPLA_LOCUS8894 [Anthophora plagiata]